MSSDGITLWPYPDIESEDPLPAGRTAERLRQDGAEDVARSVAEWNGDQAYRRRMAAYRRCTLVIRWDRVPGACWALNMPEGALTCQSEPERRIPASSPGISRGRSAATARAASATGARSRPPAWSAGSMRVPTGWTTG